MNDLRIVIRQFRKPGRCLLADAVIALRCADVCPAAHAAADPSTRGTATAEMNNILRYFLQGGTRATFQHFSLTREDNWHIVVDGLAQNRWEQVTLNFSRDARRNDGGSEPFVEGERMDDCKLFAGRPGEALCVDEVVLFDAETRKR